MAEAGAAQGPVFVHGWWRCATTYLWSRLRRDPALRCYYEPLFEGIADLTPETVMQAPPAGRLHSARHRDVQGSYFAEYEPLVASGGTGFGRELAYERYLLDPQEPDPELERYLGRLIEAAGGHGQRPVLCFVRSSMRSLWMKRRFEALHVAQLRNPRDLWGSILRVGGLRSYFAAGVVHIAMKLGPRCPRAFSHLKSVADPRAGAPQAAGRLVDFAAELGERRVYAIFVLVWLACALQSLGAADLVLDGDRLCGDGAARERAAERLAEHGITCDFSDIALPRYRELPLSAAELDGLERLALAQIAGEARGLIVCDAPRVEAALGELAEPSRRLLEPALRALG